MNHKHYQQAVYFGRELIRTRDLDPVYVALAEARLSEDVLARTLLAYFCLYHLGAASYIGAQRSAAAYWDALGLAAANLDRSWPRGAERRHWRGRAATEAVVWLRERFALKPEGVVFRWYHGAAAPTFAAVATEVKKADSFGPWIAFKVADMMERVLRLRVDFADCALGVYREPRAGAALVLTGDAATSITDDQLNDLVETFLQDRSLRKLLAPPWDDRALNVQEVETILCKYKSHVNGRYPVGKDTREVLHALNDMRWGANARRLSAPLERLL